jgi:hypothetical protein
MIESNYEPPATVFKFVCPEILIKILENSSLNFTPPNRFNDPYDCYLGLISFESNQKAIDRIKNDPKISDEQKLIKLRDMTEEPTELSQFLNESVDKILSNSGITCFSLQKENMLMWSHYGDKHTGACIEFHSDLLISKLAKKLNANNVKYVREIKSINFHESPKEAVDNIIFTKSIDWKYEKEFRILIEGNGLNPFDLSSICSITFGAKCADSIVSESKTLLEQKAIYPEFYKARLAPKQFHLIFDSI